MGLLSIEEDLETLCQLSVEYGASEAKAIKAKDIVIREWVRLKCQYGCDGYGKRLTCPPHSPTPEQFRKILHDYDWAIFMKFEPGEPKNESESAHEVTVKMEREAFLSGYYSAFALGSGPCLYCEECNLKECVHPHLARPSMEACGIDVYATARKAGFGLQVVKDRSEKPTYFGLLLVQ